jgi:bifunctional DNase/RNase
MNRLGASVNSIIINDIQERTFYANIVLNANWTEMKIDSRPSDAIGIAVRAGVPIYVEEAVLDKAGIKPRQDTDDYIIMR